MWLALAFYNPGTVAECSRWMTQEFSWGHSMITHMQNSLLSLTINRPLQFYTLLKTLEHSEDSMTQYFSTE